MTQLQKILSGLLALQLLAAIIVFWPDASATAESGPLLAEFDPEEITAITLEDGEGGLARLVRQGEGWILADSGDYPADSEKVDPLLEKIAAIQTGRLVASSSSSHKRLQVAQDEFAGRITLEKGDESQEVLLIGSAPNPRGTHVRLAGQDNTYLTGELASWEVNPRLNNWISTTYIGLDRNRVASIVLENKNGTFTFEKGADGSWTLQGLGEDEAFNATPFNTLLSRATSMQLSAPLGTSDDPAYGLAEPQAVITVVTEDEEDQSTQLYTLKVGQADSTGEEYYVKWSDSDYYVKVAAFNVETIIDHVRDDFVQEPPTPTPAAESETTTEATPEPDS
jgi:hypothetical protein